MTLPLLLLASWLAASPGTVGGTPARIAFGCAPWDGPTLELRLGIPDLLIRAEIWGRGFEALSANRRTVEIDNDGGPKGTGRGSVCPTMMPDAKCRPERLRLEFTTLELKPGGKVRGTVAWPRGLAVPFEGTIDMNPAICG